MYVALDVETKNLGSDVIGENEQLLSVQLGNDTEQRLYYYDSKAPELNLESAKIEITSLLSKGAIFAGYNIEFDVTMIKKFLGVEIPKAQTLDLCHTSEIEEFHKITTDWSLERACGKYYVNADHKRKMKEKAEQYKRRADIQEKAKANAKETLKIKPNWTPNYAYDKALNKIAVCNAIYDAYIEFIESGGQKNTLFYEYAIGDIISEYNLLKALKY